VTATVPKPKHIELGDGTKIPILYEDRSVVAIDKPPGWMLVPYSWQKTNWNLQAAIVSSLGAGDFWARSRGLKFLKFVHRLDAETTGILLFAKSQGAVESYSDLFEDRRMEKTYLAVVDGVPKQGEWKCHLKLGPAPGQIGRMKVDEREGQSPGFKFNDWEMRGVPLRMEIGPKDVAKGSVVLARRDKPGKEGKSFVSQEGIAGSVQEALVSIQKALFNRALVFRNTRTFEPKNIEEFRESVEKGFAKSRWCGESRCEEQIKETTKATLRCIPLEQPGGTGSCIFCGQPSSEVAIFGKAY